MATGMPAFEPVSHSATLFTSPLGLMRFLPRFQSVLSTLFLILPLIVVTDYLGPIWSHLMEEVLLRERVFLEVQLVDLLVLLACNDGSDRAIQAVHSRDELLQLARDVFLDIRVSSETIQDLIFVAVIELVKIFILVEVGEQLALVRIAQVWQPIQ